MARFDEFKGSLENAVLHIDEAAAELVNDEWDDHSERYWEVSNQLQNASGELEDARDDVWSGVGISCNMELLVEVIADIENLALKIQCAADNPDNHAAYVWEFKKAFASLKRDIERISQSAR